MISTLGWLSAATNLGVAIGPVLGSATAVLGERTPGLVAAVLCLVNILFASRYLTESHDVAAARAKPAAPRRAREALLRVLSHPADPASRLIWIYAIAIGAFYSTNAILALFLERRFAVTAATIGYFFTYIGVLSVLTRALVLGRMVDRFGEAPDEVDNLSEQTLLKIDMRDLRLRALQDACDELRVAGTFEGGTSLDLAPGAERLDDARRHQVDARHEQRQVDHRHVDLARRDLELAIRVAPGDVLRHIELLERLTDDFVSAIALDALCAGIPAAHDPVGVEHVEGVVGDARHQEPELALERILRALHNLRGSSAA